jgi:solute carrier family 25 (mitochondrial adenine nucleotide translocator), member 4/5/6/31
VVRYFPTQAMGFAFDDRIRLTLLKKNVSYTKSEYVMRSLACGAISGAIASTVVYPIDFARTR